MTAQLALPQPFTNVQLELLKVFAHHVSDNDLQELRMHLAQFFAQRAIAAADAAWEKNGWTDADVDRLLQTKMRASSKKP
ncbi:MAG: hypothetical protein ACK4Q5_19325 [Saprospiraceae bacterium]